MFPSDVSMLRLPLQTSRLSCRPGPAGTKTPTTQGLPKGSDGWGRRSWAKISTGSKEDKAGAKPYPKLLRSGPVREIDRASI